MGSPLAGAWVFLHLAACAAQLYNYKRNDEGLLWRVSIAWAVALGVASFLVRPMMGSGAIAFVLSATPLIGCSMRPEDLNKYLKAFGITITLYALGLIFQWAIGMRYTVYTIPGRYSWPLMDPNNGAAVLNFVLIPSIWLAFTHDRRWWLLSAVFLFAMKCTGSKAGISVAALSVWIMLLRLEGQRFLVFSMAMGIITLGAVIQYAPDVFLMFVYSFQDRFPIWSGAVKLLDLFPWTGTGLGLFPYYYAQVRTETYTGGYFAHNDLLQFLIEMGIPLGLVGSVWLAAVALTTCKTNFISALVFLAITLQASVEFQFYVPAVSLPLGVALAYHIVNRRRFLSSPGFQQPVHVGK